MRGYLIALFVGLFSSVGVVSGQVWKGDYSGAEEITKKAAAGDPEAMASYVYLSCYRQGGVPFDSELVLDYAQRSAEADNGFGLAVLANLYRGDFQTKADYGKAFEYAKRSAEKGHPFGKSRLANCYETGVPGYLQSDPKEALRLLSEAAEAGSEFARYGLASFYCRGVGVEKDVEKGLRLSLELVKELDFPFAATTVIMTMKSEGLIEKRADDYLLAVECLERAAARGDLGARHQTAFLNLAKTGEDEFLRELVELARLGRGRASLNLSYYLSRSSNHEFVMYSEAGVENHLARIGFEAGGGIFNECYSTQRVGMSYAEGGLGFSQDFDRAYQLYQFWALKGHIHYCANLSALYRAAYQAKDPRYGDPELAIAFATAHFDEGAAHYVGVLFEIFSGKMRPFEADWAKASVLAEMTEVRYGKAKRVKLVEKNITDEDRARVEGLKAAGYPAGEKQVAEARALIEASGFQFPDEDTPTERH